MTHEDEDAFQDLGDGLKQQHGKADDEADPEGPDHRVPGRLARTQVTLVGIGQEVPEAAQQQNHRRQHQKGEADQVDHRLLLPADVIVEEIDPHVPAHLQRVGEAEYEAGTHQHVRHLVGPHGRRVEEPSRDHLPDHADDEGRDDPGADIPEDLGKPLDGADDRPHQPAPLSYLFSVFFPPPANRGRPGRDAPGVHSRSRRAPWPARVTASG